jgi:chemotaxis protein methyltransferase CheR
MEDAVKILEIEDIEIELLIQAVKKMYNYDFSDYRFAHIKRRLKRRMEIDKIKSINEMTGIVLRDINFFQKILLDLSINVTEMFRCPGFFKEIREKVIPILKTYPSIKLWHAGCSTGEEIFSMAIILKEEGLLDKTKIYASDFNQSVLDIAKEGIYPVSNMKKWTENYQKAGGKNSFSAYYRANYNHVIFDDELSKNIEYVNHNLVMDEKIDNVNLIICRNVLIYFNKSLQDTVLNLFTNSLKKGGIIGLGIKENLNTTSVMDKYLDFSPKYKIYRKKVGN